MHLLLCIQSIYFIAGVASFYPYKFGTSPTQAATGSNDSIRDANSSQAAGGSNNGSSYAFKLNIKREAVSVSSGSIDWLL